MADSVVLPGVKLLAVLGLVAANGFFVAAEFALVGLRPSRVEELKGLGDKTVKALGLAIDNLDTYLAATQLGVTISSLALGWIGEAAIAELIEPALNRLGALAGFGAHAIAVGVAFVFITTFHIVLGELAPKSVALQRTEGVARWVVRPLALFAAVFKPAIFVLNGLGNAVVRMVGLQPGNAERQLHSTEELNLLVAASKEAGLVHQTQKEVVERAFAMGERRVRAIMTPRNDVHWVDADQPYDAVLRNIRRSPHDQVVIARGSLDDVAGVLRKQDLFDLHVDGTLTLAGGSDVETLVSAAMQALVVHDGQTVLQVLETFKSSGVQIALVVDEYGALRGVLTQTDLLEALAGNVAATPEDAEILRRDDGSLLVKGGMAVRDAFEQMGIGNVPEGADYRTLAGFVLGQIGAVPRAGDRFEWQGANAVWSFETVEMDLHRVDKVLVTKVCDKLPAAV